MIGYGKQSINNDDIDAVVAVLKSDHLTQGPVVSQLEDAFNVYCGSQYAVAVSSATAGLHVSCLALGVCQGDHVWTSAVSFVASANCAKYCGAQISFIDIDPKTRNLCISALQKKLEQSRLEGNLPKALIVVHFAGLPCDMAAIGALAKTYGFFIIEDAAHAIGSQYAHKKVGACEYSDVAVFSFHPVKTIAAGEGGIVLTNHAKRAKKIRQYACHGVERDSQLFNSMPSSPCYYEMQLLGFNYRLSDIHAALALSQLKRLDDFVEKRQQLVNVYNEQLKPFPLLFSKAQSASKDIIAWHIYIVECESKDVRDELHDYLKANDVLTNVHYIPIYRQPIYRPPTYSQGVKKLSNNHCSDDASFEEQYPNAERFYSRALTLPLYYDLTDNEQQHVIALIRQFFSGRMHKAGVVA